MIFSDTTGRPIATRCLSAKQLAVRNVLISHAPKRKSKMRTVPKSGYTRRMKNYFQSGHWRKLWWLNEVLSEEFQGRPTLSWTFSTPQSFPMNVKVDPNTYQTFATKVKDSKLQPGCFQLLTEEDCYYERNAILFGTMRSNIQSTSVNTTPTKSIQLLGSTRHWSVHSATN